MHPPGWQAGPPQQPPTGWQPVYPQQTLSQQELKPGQNRKPIYLGVLAAVLLVIGGVVAWQLLKDDGEDTRAAYCAALKDLTNDGDLMSAFANADMSTLNRLDDMQRLAPDAVSNDWNTLQALFESVQSGGEVDYGAVVKAVSSLRTIADDAESECGITMEVPGLP